MRKILFILCLFSVSFVKGQDMVDEPALRNTFRVGMFHFFDNTFYLNYERKLKNGNGLLLGGGAIYKEDDYERNAGYRTEVQLKIYVIEHANEKRMNKLYFAPYFTFKYLERKVYNNYPFYDEWGNMIYQPPTKEYYHSFSPGIVAGYSLTLYKRINIDMYLGGGLKRTFDADFKGRITHDNSSIWQPGYSGVLPKIGVDIGIVF